MTLQMKLLDQEGYEQVTEFTDDDGFHCIISIHNTRLGPALGGCRLRPYKTRDDALLDVIRLSKGMTYKSSLAGLNFGGGKCVIIAEKPTREIMLKLGEAVNLLNGNFITGEDIGVTLEDVQIAGEVSPHVIHCDGSPMTARGVVVCMNTAIDYLRIHRMKTPVWVQGVGKVGIDVARRIYEQNIANRYFGINEFDLQISDIRPTLIQEACLSYGATEYNESNNIDIYVPCAMGQVVNAGNVNLLKYRIICGSANNQLVENEFAEILHANHVLYCPDYLVNAGGVIDAACEIGQPYNRPLSEQLTNELGERLLNVFKIADDEKITPLAAANKIAEDRFNS